MPDETLDQREADHLNQRIYQFPMRVELIGRSTGTKEQRELLALAEERAVEPAVFQTSPPFFFRATATTDRLDSYGTHQMPSSLANYEADLNEGIAFLANHNWQSLPMGASLRGKYVRGKGESPSRTWGDFFTIPDLNLNGINTNDFIRGLQSTIVRDVSKGFYGGFWRCSICKQEQRSNNLCPHYLLEEYPEGKDGALLTCTAAVEDAHMSELSAVFDGAVPGAAIEKATQAIEAGKLPVEKARSLAIRYRSALPGTEHIWAGFTPLPPTTTVTCGSTTGTVTLTPAGVCLSPPAPAISKEAIMPDIDGRAAEGSAEWTLPATERERYRQLVTECGLKPDAPPAVIIEALRSQIASHATERDTAVTERDELKTKVSDLEPRAKDGDAYRTFLVDDAWAEYVRAGLSDGVVEKDQKALFARHAVAELQKELAHYRKMGDARFAGGRQTATTDGEIDQARGFITPSAPASAFRA